MNNRKIIIGHSIISQVGNQSRLSADVTIDDKILSLYFGVDSIYGQFLTQHRADPFLATLVNLAMVTNRDIVCQDPVSEKMLYSLRHTYIPALSFWTKEFHACKIEATPISSAIENAHGVGTGMSFGSDSLYTFQNHYQKSEYPITHICNFNNGVYGDSEGIAFNNHSSLVRNFASEMNISAVPVDTNLQDVLPERYLDVYSQRNMACALALQGLFSMYLYSSGHPEDTLKIDPHNSAYYDPLTVECFSTESLTFILSGCELSRVQKLAALGDFEPATRLMHPCFKAAINSCNCGKCWKDICDMTTLYALGLKDKFKAVYNWEPFTRTLPMNLAFLMYNSESELCNDALNVWKDAGLEIPKQAYVYTRIFEKAGKNLSDTTKEL